MLSVPYLRGRGACLGEFAVVSISTMFILILIQFDKSI